MKALVGASNQEKALSSRGLCDCEFFTNLRIAFLRFRLYSTAASLHTAGELQTSSCCNQSVFVARPVLTIIFIISLPALRFMRDFLQFSTSQQQPGYLLSSDNSLLVATILFSEEASVETYRVQMFCMLQ